MDPRYGDDGGSRGDRSGAARFEPVRQASRSERVREIRDEIGRRVEHLVGELDDRVRVDQERVG